MMNPERWQKVDQLYHDALKLDPAEHRAFLRAACAGDDELLREVRSLLAARGRVAADEGFLNPSTLSASVEILAVAPPSFIGSEISHYRVLSLLGRGGMGEVYLAQDSRLGRKVALKLLLRESTRDGQRAQRFQQEARAASALNHPNIITVFEIDQFDGAYFIVTEFIEGHTLRDRMAAARLSPGEIAEVTVQMAGALSAAHAIGITHRDIKPENIMVRHDGYVKVLDFGLAKLSEPLPGTPADAGSADAAVPVLTDPAILMGTPSYMSPEQIRRQPVDARSDIFSLGVVIYEMVTGRLPFSGATPGEIVTAVLRDEPAPARHFAPAAPAELERIIHKALAKERAERYQTSQELLADLRELKLELDLAARSKAPEQAAGLPDNFSTLISDKTESLSREMPQGETNREIEPAGGAVPLSSHYYIVRPTDEEFRAAIARRDSIVLVKGARQVGKTSLLARGLQQARAAGAKIALTDLQKLNTSDLATAETFYLALADLIADQLDLDVSLDEVWNARRGPSINFERFIRREVLGKINGPLVWGLDEVDRLFTTTFGSEVFGLFRSWHNERSLDPEGPWQRMTMAIAYATEAHLFITDMNQSPFNVGTRLALDDFNFDQVAELNSRYGSPLKNKPEIERYFRLVGGHPYLVRCGLQEMVTHPHPNLGSLAHLETIADHDDGPFGDHLRRIAASLEQDAALSEIVRGILQGKPCPTQESFYRLRSAGLVAGDSAQEAKPRCQLYATYLRKRLL